MITKHIPQQSANRKITLPEISSGRVPTLVDFIQNSRNRIAGSPRGDLIATVKTLISAGAFPAITSWADLYHFMIRRGSSNETIAEARKLWREYQKFNQPCPRAQHRRINHG
jgi:hypothetical protein